ncbi:hypothetical protein M8818_001324 [Zalaria obscura]|uniref:Uncharacterized protein n=1 Tax=Zalaria obscura TaxID=2024903 RepID=A0ACC3SKT8_9PEZI
MSQTDYPNLNPFEGNTGNTTSGPSTTTSGDASTSFENAKNSAYNTAQSAMDTVSNHPVTQQIANGEVCPVAQNMKAQANATQNEFSNLAASRKTPDYTAATGQELTHYHSLFYNLLSWQNPRATSIAFATTIVFIFFTRYVPVLKYVFKALYVILGITAAAEIAGRVIFDNGLASSMRPRKYYTIPRESLETALGDLEQMINFFVIEVQRIVFAENIYATVAAFTSALIGYFLVKIVPKWGLALIATTAIYLVPLVYLKNREVIDGHLQHAGEIVSQQTSQVRDLAAHHTSRAADMAKSTASQYSAKAQEYVGAAKQRAASPSAPNPANLNPYKNEPERDISKDDLPSVPSSEPAVPAGRDAAEPTAAVPTEPAPEKTEPILE